MTGTNKLTPDSTPPTATAEDDAEPAAQSTATSIGNPGASENRGTTTRRTLLGAGLGALLATIASALGRPTPARADGQPILVGQTAIASSPTVLQNQNNLADVLVVKSVEGAGTAIHGDSPGGRGVLGTTLRSNGVEGRSETNNGVYGYSTSGTGVYVYSGGSHAIWGYTDAQVGAEAAVASLRGQAHTDQTFGAFAEKPDRRDQGQSRRAQVGRRRPRPGRPWASSTSRQVREIPRPPWMSPAGQGSRAAAGPALRPVGVLWMWPSLAT